MGRIAEVPEGKKGKITKINEELRARTKKQKASVTPIMKSMPSVNVKELR